MFSSTKNNYLIAGISITFISFILLLISIKFVLGNELVLQNIIAFLGFSALVGIITSLLVFFKLKIVYTSFISGLIIGFFVMYSTFLKDMTGWGDLIGLLSLFMTSIFGLGFGILAHLGYSSFEKYM